VYQGGHSAIARVSLDGGSRTKIYTISGTDADKWLAKVKLENTAGAPVLPGPIQYLSNGEVPAAGSKRATEHFKGTTG
jgi:hypothetical protein